MNNYGDLTVECMHLQKKYLAKVNVTQATILISLYNNAESYTYGELKELTKLVPEVLNHSLLGLIDKNKGLI